jgi:hypothetical protein
MKKINYLSLPVIIILIVFSCWEINSDNKITIDDELASVKNLLIGEWIEISPCDSCRTFRFEDNDTIYQTDTWYENSSLALYYQVIAVDSIFVNRNWEIELIKKTTKHKINFYSIDSLELIQFFAVDYGITGFDDIKLKRIRKP